MSKQEHDPHIAARVQREIEQRAELSVDVTLRDHVLSLFGLVESEEASQAAEDVARAAAPAYFIENNIEVEELLPYAGGSLAADESMRDPRDESALADDALETELEPDFTNQPLLVDASAAIGPSSSGDDEVSEGDEVYVPPTDPVISLDASGAAHVLGGFSPTSDDVQVERSALDGRPGDEALVEAILRELREDALTTELQVRVLVRKGVAHLRGRVADVEEAEAAEEIAGRVPGVVEVIEELEVSNL
jgi:osmotically-inducible protein OsmY